MTFKEEYGGERRKRQNSHLHRIYKSPESNLGIFAHILFYPPRTIAHEMAVHTHKQLYMNNSHRSVAQMSSRQGRWRCETNANDLRDYIGDIFSWVLSLTRPYSAVHCLCLSSVCLQSQTTQEIVAGVSELSWSQVRSDQRLLGWGWGVGGGGVSQGAIWSQLHSLMRNWQSAKRELFKMRAGDHMSGGGLSTYPTS